MHGGHVDFIKIGTLLAIDFDGNKVFVEYCRDGFIVKTFHFHNMAPVTSGISNG